MGILSSDEATFTMIPIDTKEGLKYFYKYEDSDVVEVGWAELGTEISKLGEQFRQRAKKKGLSYRVSNEKINERQISFED